ncbi:MAG: hypothetical protein AAFZ80_04955, partial [Cyanobacteria bacterium P01_A01_bin.105]
MLIAASPILTRLYEPGDFGEYALFTGFSRLIAPVVTGQYESAIMLAVSEDESINIACIPISLPMLVLPLIASGLYYTARYTSFVSEAYLGFITLLLVGVVSITAYETFYYLQLKREAYGSISASKIIFSTTNISLAIAASFYSGEIAYK